MRALFPRRILLLVVISATPSLNARAEEAPSGLSEPDTEAARRHFDRGAELYNRQEYAEAMREFETAKRIKPTPAFDFNIARCLDRLERWAAAADAYALYFETLHAGKEADEIRSRIAILRARARDLAPPTGTVPVAPPAVPTAVDKSAAPAPATVDKPAALAPPVPARPSPLPSPVAPAVVAVPPQTRPSPAASPVVTAASTTVPLLARHRLYTWIVGGTGAALLVGSFAAGLVAHTRYGDLKSNCAPDGACNAATVPDAQGWIDSGHGAAVASDVLLGVGLAAVATGVVLYFVEGRHPVERHAWRIAPTVGARGAGLAFEVAP